MEDERDSTATVGRRGSTTDVPTLGSGAFRARLRHDADRIAAGELPAAKALPLLDRRLKEIGRSLQRGAGGEAIDTLELARQIVLDDHLAPLLALPAVRDLELGEPFTGAFRRATRAIKEAERAAARAEPYIAVAARFGADPSAARRLHRLATVEQELDLGPDERISRSQSIWRRQGKRRREAWEPGKGRGRQPGAEGAGPADRRRDLLARFRDMPPEKQSALSGSRVARSWIEAHAKRWGAKRRTAERDWNHVRRGLVERGEFDLLTRWLQATLSGDTERADRESARLTKLRRQFLGV
jgi:hypothetical protein